MSVHPTVSRRNACRNGNGSAIERNALSLLAIVLFGWTSAIHAAIPASERTVLTNLYSSTNGASWTTRTNWNAAFGTECTWFGVSCDAAKEHVVAITLAANKLSGSLPALSALTSLQTFSAPANQLTGAIPSLAGLAALTLFDVSNNQLSGSIPSLAGLSNLFTLAVSGNQLTGSIPSFSGLARLAYFYADNNKLTGPIPASLSDPTSGPNYFSASNNQLSGPIPSLAQSNINELHVANNLLSGPVPLPPGYQGGIGFSRLIDGFSTVCGNSLLSSGNASVDYLWQRAQNSSAIAEGYWLACQKGGGPTTCTLTASPPAITSGASSVLTANCGPAATLFSWSANSGSSATTASITVSPTVTTTYTATGTNAGGKATASVTVTVTPTVAPACTLTAAPATVSAGAAAVLTAVCSPVATSYAWTGGTCAGNASASCSVTVSATTTYTVKGINAAGTGAAASATVTVTSAPAAQVVEFYNTILDNYFITADAAEASGIDKGGAGPGWTRTGNTFASGGTTPVCRFYGSQSPGPNSHFYTADAGECAYLKQLQATTPATQKRWNFENLDFVTTPAVNGACASGQVPVYRAYNKGTTRGVDSNHRITSNPSALQEVVNRGWENEGVVMCATSGTTGGSGSTGKGAFCTLTVVSGSLSAPAGSNFVLRADCSGVATETLWYANNFSTTTLPQNNYSLIGTGPTITVQVPQAIGNTSLVTSPFNWMLVARNAYGAHAISWSAYPVTAKIPKQTTCSHIEINPANLYTSDGVTRQLDISGTCDASATYTASYGGCEAAGTSDMPTPHRTFNWTLYPSYTMYDAAKTDEYFLKDCSVGGGLHRSYFGLAPGNGGYPNPSGYGFSYILLNLRFPN